MLNKKQFSVLSVLEASGQPLSQRKIAAKAGISVGSVNHILEELKTAGLYDGVSVTKKGFAALEPYRVKRAVIHS